MFIKRFFVSVVAVIMMLCFSNAIARDPIKRVIGCVAGGGSDRIVREAQYILQNAGIPSVIEFRPGAGGEVAVQHVANSKDTGVKLLLAATNNITVRNLRPHDVYQFNNLQPVVYLGYVPLLLATSRNSNIKTLDDFLKNQRDLTLGSSGVGSGTHLAGEMIFSYTKKTMTHIPYKGNSQIMPDLISGRIDSSIIFPTQAVGLVDKGDLNAVAVIGSRRVDSLPGIPTLDERNLSGAYRKLMYVFYASPGTSTQQIQEIAQIFSRAFRDPITAQRFRNNADMEIEPEKVLDTVHIMNEEFGIYRRLAERVPSIVTRE